MDASATCALSAHPCAPIGRQGFRKFKAVSRLVLRESRLNRWARNTFHCRSCVVISADALTTSVTGSQIPKIRVSAITSAVTSRSSRTNACFDAPPGYFLTRSVSESESDSFTVRITSTVVNLPSKSPTASSTSSLLHRATRFPQSSDQVAIGTSELSPMSRVTLSAAQ